MFGNVRANPVRFVVPALPTVGNLRTKRQAEQKFAATTDYGGQQQHFALNKLLNRGKEAYLDQKGEATLPKLSSIEAVNQSQRTVN